MKEKREMIKEAALKILSGETTLAELRGFKAEHLAAIYEIGRSLYDTHQYSKAEDIFKLLCLYDPWQKNHWFGLAASRQMMGLYEEAILAYHLAFAMDEKDPQISLHLAECYLRIGDKKSAKRWAKKTLELTKDRELNRKANSILNYGKEV